MTYALIFHHQSDRTVGPLLSQEDWQGLINISEFQKEESPREMGSQRMILRSIKMDDQPPTRFETWQPVIILGTKLAKSCLRTNAETASLSSTLQPTLSLL